MYPVITAEEEEEKEEEKQGVEKGCSSRTKKTIKF
jgi:hypothetical protein